MNIIIFVSLLLFCYGNNVPFQLYKIMGGYFCSYLLGEEKHMILADIDLINDFSLASYMYYKEPINTLQFVNKVHYKENEYKVSTLSDIIILKKKEIENYIPHFHFYFINQEISDPNTFSLSFKYKDNSFSIVHLLYESKLITKKGFYMDQGDLIFGPPPNDQKIASMYKATCKVNNKKEYYHKRSWGCDLNKIYFNNSTKKPYYNNIYAKFTANHNYITIPESFMKYLNETLFNDLKEFCNYQAFPWTYSYRCRSSVFNEMNHNLVFAIEGVGFEFDRYDMFEFDGFYVNFIFRIKNETSMKSNEWEIGTAFLSKYSEYFDYENESITFYSDSSFIKIEVELKKDYKKVKIFCYLIMINVLILTIILTVISQKMLLIK